MEVTSKVNCQACQRVIDAGAKLCPYCGANPITGEKVDTQAIMQEVFGGKQLTTSESVFQFARHRQGIVIAVGVVVVFLVLAGLHQFVTARNAREVTNAPPVPLTELTDLSAAAATERPVDLPELNFQYNGRPETMRTFIVEQGAAPPPEVVAEQQAAQLAAQQAAAAKAAAAPPRTAAATVPQPGQAPMRAASAPVRQTSPPMRPAPQPARP